MFIRPYKYRSGFKFCLRYLEGLFYPCKSSVSIPDFIVAHLLAKQDSRSE